MACRLFGTMPLPTSVLTYCQLDCKEQPEVKFESKYKLFIHENTFENVVCEVMVILSGGDESIN